jgi:quercetin dioxygenase-like cupin family protein
MALEKGLRRVVTEATKGRSAIAIDAGPASSIFAGEAGLAEIWEAVLKPGALLAGVDRLSKTPVRLEPALGAVKVRWFTIEPEKAAPARPAVDELAAAAFAAVGAAHCRVDTARHPMMHKTGSLDVIVLVKGEVDMLVDDGEARGLKPGDVVIQRAANHAWINRGTETALLVAVLMDAGDR